MVGGFAMIAWPAAWRESGVMAFMVGPDMQSIVDGIRAYDPGQGWVRAESEEAKPARH